MFCGGICAPGFHVPKLLGQLVPQTVAAEQETICRAVDAGADVRFHLAGGAERLGEAALVRVVARFLRCDFPALYQDTQQ